MQQSVALARDAIVNTVPESPSRALFADILAAFPTLPTGVSHPPYQSTGIDFFPGGTGCACRNAPFPVGGVMILGHNYGSDLDFSQNIANRGNVVARVRWKTCRNTWNALHRWGIDPATCFFTNFYPGYVTTRDKDGKPFNMGRHPHVGNVAFVRPSGISSCGRYRRNGRARCWCLAPTCHRCWRQLDPSAVRRGHRGGLRRTGQSGASIVRGITIGGHTFNVCHRGAPEHARECMAAQVWHATRGEAEDAIVRATLEARP